GLSPGPARPVMTKGPIAGAPVIVVSTDSATEKANLAAVQQEMEAFNKHDVAGAVGTAGDDTVEMDQATSEDTKGRAKIEAGLKDLFGSFSDVKLTALAAYSAGDYVLVLGKFNGTNDGDMPMMKMKKTGKKVDV